MLIFLTFLKILFCIRADLKLDVKRSFAKGSRSAQGLKVGPVGVRAAALNGMSG